MKAATCDLVYRAKIIHYKGPNFDSSLTWHEMTKLLNGIFAGDWRVSPNVQQKQHQTEQ